MRTSLRRVAITAATLVTAAAAVVTTITPATAMAWDYGPYYTTDGGRRGGAVVFEKHGDKLKVCDRSADGHSVKATVAYGETDLDEVYKEWVRGNGNCASVDASDGVPWNLKENRWIAVNVCRAQGIEIDYLDCSRWYHIYNDS